MENWADSGAIHEERRPESKGGKGSGLVVPDISNS